MINIGGGSADSSYRYKMPRIVGKIEGRGNGIKTVIANCVEVCESLNRKPTYLTKFLGIELAAQSRWREAELRSIVNGSHSDADLQNLVHKFVDIFVLCPTCTYPETKLKISTKNKTIMHVCKACGEKHMVDLTHRLCTFIIKEAKREKKLSKDGKKKGDKKKKKDKRGKKEKRDKKKKRSEETAGAEAAAAVDDVDVFETECTAAAVAARKKEEMEHLAPQVKLSPDEAIAVSAKQLQQYIGSDLRTVIDNLSKMQVTHSLPVRARLNIFFNAVMQENTTAKDFLTSVQTYQSVFTQLVMPDPKGQETLLTVIERFFCEKEKFRPVVPVLLQTFYNADILEEDAIIEWHTNSPAEGCDAAVKANTAAVKAAAQKFVDWLGEEDEEDSEEEAD